MPKGIFFDPFINNFVELNYSTIKMEKYIGYRAVDHAVGYAKFYNENIKPIPAHAKAGLEKSPYPAGQLPSVEQAPALLKSGYSELETGYTLERDGSLRVAVLTAMPGVAPYMWDWWFGWHGCKADRYKLWHPKAHRNAEWKDGRADLSYIGRTSMIEEYIGPRMEKASIRFVAPSALGFDAKSLENKSEVVLICARVGYTNLPLDFGWLVHQIRAVEGGSEMRSRFWMGGPHIHIRARGALPALVSKALQKLKRLPEKQAVDLLTHCSEEMNHLASFLPQLYTEFH
jgi:DAPG hydrolase PhiG domain